MLEQIAGDELPEGDRTPENLVATGYFRLGPWDDEPADPKQDRYDQLDDIVTTTSEVFLGLTLGCARCHNHKFEPLSMHDYYRMVAVFEPLQRPGERPHRADTADRHARQIAGRREKAGPGILPSRAFLETADEPPAAPWPGGQPGARGRPRRSGRARRLATCVPDAAGRRHHVAAPAHTGAMVDGSRTTR